MTTYLRKVKKRVQEGGNRYISLRCALRDQQELREVFGMKTEIITVDLRVGNFNQLYILKEEK